MLFLDVQHRPTYSSATVLDQDVNTLVVISWENEQITLSERPSPLEISVEDFASINTSVLSFLGQVRERWKPQNTILPRHKEEFLVRKTPVDAEDSVKMNCGIGTTLFGGEWLLSTGKIELPARPELVFQWTEAVRFFELYQQFIRHIREF